MKKKFLVLGLLTVIVAGLLIQSYLSYTPKLNAGKGKIKVNLKINFGYSNASKTIEAMNSTTAFDVLNNSEKVGYTEFSGMGKMINSIGGISSNNSFYWLYFVDEQIAQVACDKYILTKDSSVYFQLTSSEESMKYFK